MRAIPSSIRAAAAWWTQAWRTLRARHAGRAQTLDVHALSPHWRRDLNLPDKADAWDKPYHHWTRRG